MQGRRLSPVWAAFALVLAGGCQRLNPAFTSVAPVDSGPEALPAAPDVAGPEAAPDVAAAEAAPDEAAGDTLPPGAAATERTVTVAAGGTTSEYGGPTGTRSVDTCGAGEALVGYVGYKRLYQGAAVDDYVHSVQAVCGRLLIPAGATAVSVVSIRTLDLRGDAGTTPWMAMCPLDHVVVGFGALLPADPEVDHLQFHCAPLAMAAAPPGAILPGLASKLAWTGGSTPTTEVTTACPPGEVGHGHIVRVGSWLDSFQVTCGRPAAAP